MVGRWCGDGGEMAGRWRGKGGETGLVVLEGTSHAASTAPPWRRLTRMRAASSAKPSPVSWSVPPPAALPCAAAPLASTAAVTLSTPRTAVSPSGLA